MIPSWGTGNGKEREIIYAAQCFKHKVLYIGYTGEQLSQRFSKHCYDIKNRPDNSELAKHFHESHNLIDDLNVTILQNNIKTASTRRYREDKWICKLKTLAPHSLQIYYFQNFLEDSFSQIDSYQIFREDLISRI